MGSVGHELGVVVLWPPDTQPRYSTSTRILGVEESLHCHVSRDFPVSVMLSIIDRIVLIASSR